MTKMIMKAWSNDLDILVDIDDIMTMKLESEYDSMYGVEKKLSTITFKNGLTQKVKTTPQEVHSHIYPSRADQWR